MGRKEEIIKERIKKVVELMDKNINPYAYRFDVKDYSKEIKEKYKKLKNNQKTKDKVVIAGRVMTIRDLGKLIFGTVQDSQGRIQIILQKEETDKNSFELFKKYIDAGDFVGINGSIMKTKTGEISVLVKKLELLTKSILPLPEKWHGLQDKEERYRKRYLDLIMNPEVKQVFEKRQKVFDAIREFLTSRGFLEVQTPVLQPIYGGTNAKPFESKLNSLDMKVYMRISNEMYLKRLIVGGYDKIFEFSPDFRNEGIDKLHNPEFTQVETMWAYANYEDNMKLWPELVEYITKKLYGKTKIKIGDNEIDFKAPWTKIKFIDSIKKYAKVNVSDIKDLEEAKKIVKKLNIDVDKCNSVGEVLINIFEEIVQPKIIQPTLVYDYPKEAAVLSRSEDGKYAKSFEVIINGWEIALSYCEENDPVLLKKKWEEQEKALKKGDEEAQRMDLEFINALETGMPPTSGVGMGIDRLVMLMTNQPS
ncbi:MAG: lysine--tRNA ligase, partial [Candidatus Nanoarchaeia archaeon]|nr:lysine--tRNA ligase [Candidatus Nanoarchaeia archaeon]